MKNLLAAIIGTTFLIGGCAGQKDMQRQVDTLTSQVTTLTEEKQKISEEHKLAEKQISFLCAMIGENSTADPMTGKPTVIYLGNNTFQHPASGDIHKMDEMIEKCIDMAGQYEEFVRARAGSLLEDPKKLESSKEE